MCCLLWASHGSPGLTRSNCVVLSEGSPDLELPWQQAFVSIQPILPGSWLQP